MGDDSLEWLAVWFYRRHRLDPTEPESTLRLARMELGNDAVRAERVFDSPGAMWTHRGRTYISYEPTLPAERVNHVVGHELAHVLLSWEDYDGGDMEAACDRLGAALMAPNRAIALLYREHGFDLERLSEAAIGTQTWAALRIGESLGLPTATLSPVAVRTRGPLPWDERAARSMAEQPPDGVERVRLTDEHGRVALFRKDR